MMVEGVLHSCIRCGKREVVRMEFKPLKPTPYRICDVCRERDNPKPEKVYVPVKRKAKRKKKKLLNKPCGICGDLYLVSAEVFRRKTFLRLCIPCRKSRQETMVRERYRWIMLGV